LTSRTFPPDGEPSKICQKALAERASRLPENGQWGARSRFAPQGCGDAEGLHRREKKTGSCSVPRQASRFHSRTSFGDHCIPSWPNSISRGVAHMLSAASASHGSARMTFRRTWNASDGHEDEEIGDRYSKLKQDVEFRQGSCKENRFGV